jgi:hypothetical protein
MRTHSGSFAERTDRNPALRIDSRRKGYQWLSRREPLEMFSRSCSNARPVQASSHFFPSRSSHALAAPISDPQATSEVRS